MPVQQVAGTEGNIAGIFYFTTYRFNGFLFLNYFANNIISGKTTIILNEE